MRSPTLTRNRRLSLVVALAVATSTCPVPSAQSSPPSTVHRSPRRAETSDSVKLASLDLSTFTIPDRLGFVVERWQPEGRAPRGFIVHIQDLHTHPEAQTTLSELIRHLHDTYGVDRVALEGAEGLCDTTFYSDFPDPPSTEKIARLFLHEGLFTGAEYYAITHPGRVTLWGVEDEATYLKHLAVYQRNAEAVVHLRTTLAHLKTVLVRLRAALYPTPLKQLDAASARYDAGQLDFQDYVTVLMHLAAKTHLNLQAYPRVRALARDRKAPADLQALTEELDRLEAALRERLLVTDDQRQLARFIEWHQLLDDLAYVRLDPKGWARLQELQPALSAETLWSFLITPLPRAPSPKPRANGRLVPRFHEDLVALFDQLPQLTEFYRLAAQRDDALVRNLLRQVEGRRLMVEGGREVEGGRWKVEGGASTFHLPPVVLVAGGFHTPAITERLRRQNVAYAVIVPAISGDFDERLYHATLGHRLPSLDELASKLEAQTLVPPLGTNSNLRVPVDGLQRSPPPDGAPRQSEDKPTLPKREALFLYFLALKAKLLAAMRNGLDDLRMWITQHPREAFMYGISLGYVGGKLLLSAMGYEVPLGWDDATAVAMSLIPTGPLGGGEEGDDQLPEEVRARLNRITMHLNSENVRGKREALADLARLVEEVPQAATPANLALVVGRLGDTAWDVRAAALRALPSFLQANHDLATPENLALVVGRLGDTDSGVRAAALRALPSFLSLGRGVLTEQAVEGLRTFFQETYPTQDPSLLVETFLLFAEQDVRGLSLGSQQLVKLWIFNHLHKEESPAQLRQTLREVLLPTLRFLQALSMDVPTMGAEFKRAWDPNAAEAIQRQVMRSNFTMEVAMPHAVGASFLAPGDRAEIRVLPAPYPILVLLLEEHLTAGILDKDYTYHTSIEGELHQEAIPLLMSSFFMDLPEGLLLPFYRDESDLGFGDIYQGYIGQTVNAQGLVEGTQTNLYDKTLGGRELHARFGPDMERKALLARAAYAFLKAPPQHVPQEARLAAAYRAFKDHLLSYVKSPGLYSWPSPYELVANLKVVKSSNTQLCFRVL